jgi:integrase
MSKQIGVKARQKNRNDEIRHVLIRASEIIDDLLPVEPPLQQVEFLTQWEKMEEKLRGTFGEARDFKLAFNRAVNTVENYRKKNNWQVSAPAYLFTAKPEKQTKNINWVRTAWKFEQEYRGWYEKFITQPPAERTIKQQFQAVILSFMCHSGHCSYPLIIAFSKQLVSPLHIVNAGGFPLITLSHKASGFNTNVYDEAGNSTTQNQCYLSPFTLGLIKQWQSLDLKSWTPPTSHLALYNQLVFGMDRGLEYFPASLNKLCKVATYIVERTEGTSINQALSEYVSGCTKSYSLPLNNLARIDTILVAQGRFKSNENTANNSDAPANVPTAIHNHSNSDLFHRLKVALKKADPKQKRSEKALENALLSIAKLPLPIEQQALLQWFIYKLDTTCNPKTIANYHSLLTRRWLFAFEGENIEGMSPSQIAEIYREIIEKAPTEKVKQSLTKRISDLHGFCVSQFGFPALLELINNNAKQSNHTRAGFIDEVLFKATLQEIEHLNNLSDDNKDTLKCIAIISFRCNLRIGEIRKLTLNQIEKSEIGWMQIRTNKIGNNKKSASLRKVPLYPLLTESENKLVNDCIARKRILSMADNNLAFTLGSDIYTPFDELYVSSTISGILRHLSQLEFLVFHHLRHSCISRIQLMVEIEDAYALLPNAVPYSREQSQAITQLICGQSLRNKYYGIASFDGHATPVTCFSNYFHFSDWIVAYKLSKSTQNINPQENHAFGITSRRHFSKLQKKYSNSVRIEHCYGEVSEKLQIQRLKPKLLKATEFKAKQQEDVQNKQISIMLCYDILKKIEQGYAPELLAIEFNINIQLIKKWIDNAKYIQKIKTKRSNPAPRHSRPSSLLQGKPPSSKELAFLDKIIINMRVKFKENNDKNKNKERIVNMLKHALENKCMNQSGINFNWPEDLEYFLHAFENIIPKSYWRVVTYTIEQSVILDEWEIAYKNIKTRKGKKAKSTGATGRGYVRLELIHPDEASIKATHKETNMQKLNKLKFFNVLNTSPVKKNKPKKMIKKYSSNSLSFFIHMMGIMMLNRGRVHL